MNTCTHANAQVQVRAQDMHKHMQTHMKHNVLWWHTIRLRLWGTQYAPYPALDTPPQGATLAFFFFDIHMFINKFANRIQTKITISSRITHAPDSTHQL